MIERAPVTPEPPDPVAWIDAQVAAILTVRPDLARTYGPAYQARLIADLTKQGMDPAEALLLAQRLVRNAIFHAGVSGRIKASTNPSTS